MGAVERVRELVFPIVEQAGAELYDLEFEGGTLRVAVDREGGIDVDTIGEISSLISEALDLHDPVPDQRYLLEVTSPGIERKLRTPQHFAKQVGEEINVKLRAGVEGDRRISARLDAADDEGIDVTVAGQDTRRIAYSDIESARTIFNWGADTATEAEGQRAPRQKTEKNKPTKKKAAAR